MTTPSQISEMLAAQAESLVRELLPHGKKEGTEWCVGSTSGEVGKSLKIQLVGQRAGIWKDFATNDKGGDLLDLWAAVHGLSLSNAIKEAKQYLGIRDPIFETGKKREYAKPERPQGLAVIEFGDDVQRFLHKRKLKPEIVERYRVGTANGGRTLVFPYFDPDGKEVVHIAYRDANEKKFWSSKGTRPALFGWQAIDPKSRMVVITEGQLDAMAMAQYGWPALSIPFGAGKGHNDWISDEWESLERFETIFLAFDMDDAGQQALPEVIGRLGRHRCRVVTLPHKDANECLMQGIADDIIADAIAEAKTMDPTELRQATTYIDEVYREFHPQDQKLVGFMPPWNKLSTQFQFRYGEVTVLAGVNGHGKSEGVGHITASALAQGVRSCVASLEFRPRKWLARLARQSLCTFAPEMDGLKRLNQWYGDKLWVFDCVGRAAADHLLDCFNYAYRRYGVRFFVIDNLSKLGIGEDDYNGQKSVIEKVTSFAVEHDVHIIVVAHMRKGDGSQDYEKGGKWGVKGTGAITDLVDNVIIWWRNKPKEDKLLRLSMPADPDSGETEEEREQERKKLLEKADAICEVEKQRNGTGEEPRQALWFHRESHQFLPTRDAAPQRFV